MGSEWIDAKVNPPLFGQVVVLAVGPQPYNLILATRDSSRQYKAFIPSWVNDRCPMVIDITKEKELYWLPIPTLNLDSPDET